MPACCTYTKPNGQPCRADALPDSPLCLFHDPRHQDTLAQARSKGGAAPRRRSRRLPPILDHLHVAQLLSELLVDAVNETDPSNPRQLQAVTGLSRALLKAVGVPATFALHGDRSEPPPTSDHLLRRYRPQPAEEELLADSLLPDQVEEVKQRLPVPSASPLQRGSLAVDGGFSPRNAGQELAPKVSAPCPVETSPEPPAAHRVPSVGVLLLVPSSSPDGAPTDAGPGAEQVAEQGVNRAWTGLPATTPFFALNQVTVEQTPVLPLPAPKPPRSRKPSPRPRAGLLFTAPITPSLTTPPALTALRRPLFPADDAGVPGSLDLRDLNLPRPAIGLLAPIRHTVPSPRPPPLPPHVCLPGAQAGDFRRRPRRFG